MKNSLLVLLFLLLSLPVFSQTCTLSVNLSSAGTSVCSGNSVILTATASGGSGPYTYVWSTGETTTTISVNKAATYTVTVSDKTPGCQPVQKSIAITVSAVPPAPTAAGKTVCQNSPATLTATAPGGTYQWYDAPTGGNFLFTGTTYVTPAITAATTFYVETTVSGCTSGRTAVLVNVYGKPVVTGATVCSGDVATLTASGQDSYVWYDAPTGGTIVSTTATFVTPPLIANATYYVESTINGCVIARTPVSAKVTPPPSAPTSTDVTICAGSTANLHADAAAGIIDWFDVPTGGTSLISSPDYTTPVLNATTTYYVQTTTANGCASVRTPVKVNVSASPPVPVVQDMTICFGTSAAITPTGPGGTYNWYDAAVGGNLLATNPTFNTPVLNTTTTYYVRTSNGGCFSARVPVKITVNTQTTPPFASGVLICAGTTATLTATGPGGNYKWYDKATGGTLLITNATYVTPALSVNTTYYVETDLGGCNSPRTAVTVTIMPIVPPPTATGTSTCSGSPVTLTASGGSVTYEWYDSATNGNLLSSGPNFVTPALVTNTTYYVQTTNNNGCSSTRTAVAVTVTALPAAPTTTGASVCAGTTANLSASATGGTLQWYDAATGGTLLTTGNTYTTPPLAANTTYYVQHTVGTCISSTRTPVIASIIPIANPQFRYSSGTFCTSGSNPTPTINNPAGGTFTASPAGLVFVSTTTGQINVAASAPNDYTISFHYNGPCPGTATARITITALPQSQFSYSGPFCQNGSNPFPVFTAGSSGGTFSSSPAGLVFTNASTGEINLATSSAGTYTITNTIGASGACLASVSTSSVTIDRQVIISAGPDQTVNAGTPVQLAGSITGGATTGTWTGGAGTFSDNTLLNAVYTPAAGETTVTLVLRSADPPGPCGSVADAMTITINAAPAAPTALGAGVCAGSSATLRATAPGGTYRWYDAATGGTLLVTSATYVTPPINANTTFYVQTTVAGVNSTRTPVTVTISPPPPPPTAAPMSVCSGSSATLTASGSTGTYQWYDTPTGGNLLSVTNTYDTPLLTTNTSYYVQTTVNGCESSRTKVDVTINPSPRVTSASTGSLCSGNGQNYTITADMAGTTFTWSRAAVAGVSNPTVINQTTNIIDEALINTGTTPINVTYIITPSANGCTGPSFNYVVTVNQGPAVTSTPTTTICSSTAVNYAIAFNSAGTTFTWSRPVVPGISNSAVMGQAAATIREVLYNTTNAPVDVTYVFTYTKGNCINATFNFVVIVNPEVNVTSADNGTACSGFAQNYVITSNIPTATFTWKRAVAPNISNPAVNGQTSSIIDENLINTGTTNARVNYIITPTANGCDGIPFQYSVFVSPQPPTPKANGNSPVCVGSSIKLTTPVIPKVTYNWTGPNGFTSPLQNPDDIPASAATAGTYSLYVTAATGCSSLTSTVTIVVNDKPVADAGPATMPVCNNVASVQLAGSITGGTTTGIWSTKGTGTFQPANNILNAQYIPSAQDKTNGSVKLTLTSTSKDDCNIAFDDVTITFTTPRITSGPTGTACTGTAQNYTIVSNFATADFTWSRASVAGISNPAVSNVAQGTIDETLINTTTSAIDVAYIITPSDNGCPGTPFTYTVTVNPTPVTPIATVAKQFVCVGNTIQLQTPAIANATYTWTGPNGFNSTGQSANLSIPNVTAANSGTYSLTVLINGCPSLPATVKVTVDELPHADAGGDQVACVATTPISIQGSVTGGTSTGIWTTSGTGTFSPSNTALTAQYIPSAQDIASGAVTLTLASTSSDDCSISTSTITIKFQKSPGADAGPDQEICSQGSAQLSGTIVPPGGGFWSSTGTGTFSPSANDLTAVYNPSAADISKGSVTLTLNANNPGLCYFPTDQMVLKFLPPPTVDAGGTRFVNKGNTITLTPTVSDENVQYLWTPNTNISDNTIKNPVVTGNVDITYTLRVTDVRGCSAFSTTTIKVNPPIIIPNTFTPNGDGINDQWNIYGLPAYPDALVDVFDRYGQKVFHSRGYGVAWDGTYNGKTLPFGVYYYIIDTKMNGLVLSGHITIVK